MAINKLFIALCVLAFMLGISWLITRETFPLGLQWLARLVMFSIFLTSLFELKSYWLMTIFTGTHIMLVIRDVANGYTELPFTITGRPELNLLTLGFVVVLVYAFIATFFVLRRKQADRKGKEKVIYVSVHDNHEGNLIEG